LEGSCGVVLKGIDAGNSLEEDVNQILSWEVAGLEVRKTGSETSVDGAEEEVVEDHGISGVENIVVESLSIERRKLIPSILGDESSEELIDQRISLPGLLSVVIGTEDGVVVGFSGSPHSNNSVSGSDQTSSGNFQSDCSDVGSSEDIVAVVLVDSSREGGSVDGDEVHQIEDFAKIDGEAVSSLSDEDLSRSSRASWEGHGENELVRVILIRPRDGLVSCIVKGNGPEIDSVIGLDDGSGSGGSDEVESVVSEIIQTRLVVWPIQRGDHLQGNWHLEAGNVKFQTRSIVRQLVIENE